MTRLRPVVAGGDLDDQLGLVALRQPDDAAAEARSGQARPHRARLDERRQGVEPGVETSKSSRRLRRLVQQRAERGDVSASAAAASSTRAFWRRRTGPRLVGDPPRVASRRAEPSSAAIDSHDSRRSA